MRKVNTYPDRRGTRATLETMMLCYGSIIRQNPRAWLFGIRFTRSELSQFPDIAKALNKTIIISLNGQLAA